MSGVWKTKLIWFSPLIGKGSVLQSVTVLAKSCKKWVTLSLFEDDFEFDGTICKLRHLLLLSVVNVFPDQALSTTTCGTLGVSVTDSNVQYAWLSSVLCAWSVWYNEKQCTVVYILSDICMKVKSSLARTKDLEMFTVSSITHTHHKKKGQKKVDWYSKREINREWKLRLRIALAHYDRG